jgi:hypothetical protein
MNKFIGTWKLKSWVSQNASEIIYPYGKNPSGYISYLSDKLMTVVIMRDQRDIPDIFKTVIPLDATDEECIAGFKSYLSYWGKYEVDEESKIIMHKLEGCWYPKWIGTEQERHFEFKDDLLLLSSRIGKAKHILTWQKMRAPN